MMTKDEMIVKIKENMRLETEDYDLRISDIITDVLSYCHLHPNKIPEELEPICRQKLHRMMVFEEKNKNGLQSEIQSIKEGDGSITFVTGGDFTYANVYGLSEADKKKLKEFRRMSGYA